MEGLPPVDVREWLLDCLRLLVQRRGADRLLTASLVREAQLGPWARGTEGLAAVARRLDEAADLHPLRLELRPGAAEPGALRPIYHPGAPVALLGLDGPAALLAVRAEAVPDLGLAAGLLAHELAHAWRLRQHLAVDDADTEERLTDLTGVWLGFGALLARRAARGRAGRAGSGWAPGGLELGAITFLVAAQVLARRMGCLPTCGVARALPGSARAAFVASIHHLRRLPGGIAERLQLPEEGRGIRAPAGAERGVERTS